MITPSYYGKELSDQPIWLTNGTPFKFEFLETSDAWLIQELNAAVQNGVGGVYKITKEQYDEGIKKKSATKSQGTSVRYRQELQSPNLFNQQARVSPVGRAVVGGVKASIPIGQTELPDPLQVPDPSQFKMPSIGKAP